MKQAPCIHCSDKLMCRDSAHCNEYQKYRRDKKKAKEDKEKRTSSLMLENE